ncbi:hypothetical protein [Aliifodinibius sp. S!AR15-10]|uniref:hypothetical protein n=1 Tax=Aliifodinibius sp. S!AR15-10 TaxID=2950437 RepID=UPI00286FBCDB|nr:hypothetical protein [Aliifodinibius sp. S!AR15-10]
MGSLLPDPYKKGYCHSQTLAGSWEEQHIPFSSAWAEFMRLPKKSKPGNGCLNN